MPSSDKFCLAVFKLGMILIKLIIFHFGRLLFWLMSILVFGHFGFQLDHYFPGWVGVGGINNTANSIATGTELGNTPGTRVGSGFRGKTTENQFFFEKKSKLPKKYFFLLCQNMGGNKISAS